MDLRLPILALAASLLPLQTGAQQDHSGTPPSDDMPTVPDGWVKLDAVGKLRLWVPDKTVFTGTGKTEFLIRIREIYAAFEGIYGLKNASVRAGSEESQFEEKDRREASLLLFRNDAEYDKWLMEAGKALVTVHEGRSMSVVGFPLVDGAVPRDRWPELWHLLSHVFIHHLLYFDPPLWLNEGLAEYLAYSGKKVRPTEYPSFNAMLDRLRAAKEKGEAIPVSKLFARRKEALTRAEADEAWLLVHMLITQAEAVFSDMSKALITLESMATEGEQGVVADIHRLLQYLVEGAFGGEAGLQEVWDAHRNAVLKSPTMIPKLPKAPGKIAALVPILDVDFSATWPPPNPNPGGFVEQVVLVTGTLRPCLPWAGKVTINGAVGDSKGNWSQDYGVTKGKTDTKGTALTWSKVKFPIGGTAREARVVVYWVPDGGGLYRKTVVRKLGKK